MLNIVNLADITYTDLVENSRRIGSEMPAARYGGRRVELRRVMGARKLGYNIIVIAPGRRAYPRYNHRVNEEMSFVLKGGGEIRIGDDIFPVRENDVIAYTPGRPETAHRLRNTGNTELKILAVSTAESPEICEHSDSGNSACWHLPVRARTDGSMCSCRAPDRITRLRGGRMPHAALARFRIQKEGRRR